MVKMRPAITILMLEYSNIPGSIQPYDVSIGGRGGDESTGYGYG